MGHVTLKQRDGFCGMFRTNVFRYMSIAIIENRYFKGFNLVCVILATACLSLEDRENMLHCVAGCCRVLQGVTIW